MAKKESDGYILLHRKIRDNPLWKDKPFTKGQAWIDMLMMANHDGKEILLGTEIVKLERGQFIRTERSLASAWGWGRTRVRSFLKMLQNQTMIYTKTEPKGNQITIVNYEEYQNPQTKLKPKPNQNRTKTEPRPNQEKECIKECKKENILYVQLEIEKYKTLCEEFGQDVIDDKILDMDFWIQNNKKGKSPYVDYNRAIRQWLKKDKIHGKQRDDRGSSDPFLRGLLERADEEPDG